MISELIVCWCYFWSHYLFFRYEKDADDIPLIDAAGFQISCCILSKPFQTRVFYELMSFFDAENAFIVDGNITHHKQKKYSFMVDRQSPDFEFGLRYNGKERIERGAYFCTILGQM